VRINTNVAAINTQRNLNSIQGSLAKSVERLSSGLRINRAGDDAAGLTISEKLRGQVKGLNQAMRNAQDGISMIQTAEGGLNETHSILQRMRELAVQGANETLTSTDREAIGEELKSLRNEVNRIADTTQFNTKDLLNGTLSTSVSGGTLTVGSAQAGAHVSKIDVSGAAAGATFTMSEVSAGVVRLTSSLGGTQDVTLSAMAAGATANQTLDFSNLGVKVSLTGVDTAANLSNALAAETITTGAGSSSAKFQVGANVGVAQTVTVAIDSARSDAVNGGNGFGAYVAGGATSLSDAVDDFTGGGYTTVDANDLIKSLDQAISDVSKSRANLGAVQNRLEHTIENLAVSSENLQASESRIRDADMAHEMVGFTRSNVLQQAATSILAQANQMSQGVLSLLR
jgi:flagellin